MLISLPRQAVAGSKIAGKAKMRGNHAHILAPTAVSGPSALFFRLLYPLPFGKIISWTYFKIVVKRDNGDSPHCHVFPRKRDKRDSPRCHAKGKEKVL